MNDVLISPSILSADFAAMGRGVEDAERWGADMIHCDVMDGVFVPNLTFGMPMVRALKPHSDKPFDVHLMIVEPEKYVGEFVAAGADIVTFHPDASKDVAGAIAKIKSGGARAGLALNPDKGLKLVEPFLNDVDLLLIMSVYAGFGGQKYIVETTDKIARAASMIRASGRRIILEVDGGITEKNAAEVRSAGADALVAGSSVYKSQDPEKTIKILRGDII